MRGKQNHRLVPALALPTWGKPRCFDRLGQRLGFEHHALAAAKGTVVYGAVPVMRELRQIVRLDL